MYLMFDIGGTKTRVASSNDLKTIADHEIFATPAHFEQGVDKIVETGLKLAQDKPIKALAGGIGNPLDSQKTKIVSTFKPTFADWVHKPLKDQLEKKLNTDCYLENDASMVALGEAVHGAGRGERIVAYLTISTGVGGSRIVGGKIDAASVGFEPGNQIIDPGNTLCPDGPAPGRLEQILGGDFIAEREGRSAREIEDKEYWRWASEILAYGINNLIVFWSPDVVVLGGSIAKDLDLDITEKKLLEILEIYPKLPSLKKATLKDLGGIYGAMAYLAAFPVTSATSQRKH